jgi:hypothetical protein
MRRSFRRLVAIVTVFGLLAVQGMVAAHACTASFDATLNLAPAVTMGEGMVDCPGMPDTSETGLCLQHCAQGHEASNTVGAADFPAAALGRYVIVAPASMDFTASSRAAARPAARSTSPPPLLLSQRLRI